MLVFAKNSGKNDDLWKVTDQVLSAVMMDADSEKNKYDDFVNAVFNVKESKAFGEKTSSITSFATFQEVGEGEVLPLDSIEQGFSKLIEHKTYGKKFACTLEMKEDGRIDDMKTYASGLVRSYKTTRAGIASAFMSAEGTTYTYNGKSYDRTTGDGKALFAQDHPGVKPGVATQSNVFTNAFGSDTVMLNRLKNLGRNFKNQSGFPQGYDYDTIIIPANVPVLEDLVKRIIKSDLIVGSANNDINTQQGAWKLIIDPLWNAASGSPYILMSSQANKDLMGNLLYDRVPLEVRNWVDEDTRDLCWSGRGRVGIGARDWRQVIMGGAAAGTTLS